MHCLGDQLSFMRAQAKFDEKEQERLDSIQLGSNFLRDIVVSTCWLPSVCPDAHRYRRNNTVQTYIILVDMAGDSWSSELRGEMRILPSNSIVSPLTGNFSWSMTSPSFFSTSLPDSITASNSVCCRCWNDGSCWRILARRILLALERILCRPVRCFCCALRGSTPEAELERRNRWILRVAGECLQAIVA